MIDSETDWIWDFWTIREGGPEDGTTHLFFLTAPRSLGDPELRHLHARVGHATSTDLVSWTHLPDALVAQPPPAYDDMATWTGSVVADPAGGWRMFTSGLSSAEDGTVQRVGASTSWDLVSWTRTDWTLEADPRWYLLADHRGEIHWRDPFVVADDTGTWHMYLTAKSAAPWDRGNGVIGHATSRDLQTWTVRPPLSAASGRFDQAEVVSLARVDGRWVLLFSCLGADMPRDRPGDGGVWCVPVAGPGSSVDLEAAVRLTGEDRYVGRIVEGPGRESGPAFLAFRHADGRGRFVGGVPDPLPVSWRLDGRGLVIGG